MNNRNASLKFKLMLICLAPLILVSGVLVWQTSMELSRLKAEQMEITHESLVAQKTVELKSLIIMAQSAIDNAIANANGRSEAEVIKGVVHNLTYEGGGYFFVNSYDFYAIANGRIPPFEKRKLNLDSEPGVTHPLINMANIAKSGGGTVDYLAPKRGEDPDVYYPKMAYVQPINGHDWFLGTGFYIDDIDDAVNARRVAFEDTLKNVYIKTAVILVVMLLLSFFLVSFLMLRSLRPLDIMNATLIDISKGDGDLTKRLAIQTNDEIGRCAQSFNDFSEKIRKIITTVIDASKNITLSTDSLDASSATSFERVSSQRAQAEQLATATRELLATSQEITKNCSDASAAVDDVSRETDKTYAALNTSVDQLKSLDEEISVSTDSIESLEKESESIGGILEVIQKIAEQTNLLALNAAIEAARAGEQGRGFAVVADEVRTLASRTQVSTEEIRDNIERLQSSAKGTVAAMQGMRDSSIKTIEATEQSKQSLNSVTDTVAKILGLNTQVVTASEQQTHVTEELNKSIHSLLESATDIELEVKSITSTSHQLKTNVTVLNNEIGHFKTGGN